MNVVEQEFTPLVETVIILSLFWGINVNFENIHKVENKSPKMFENRGAVSL